MRTLKFKELDVSNNVLNGIESAKLNEASPLQESIISNAVGNKNLMIKAEAGDEKNTALAIAALEKLNQCEKKDQSCILVLTARPDSARQINEQIASIGLSKKISMCVDNEGDRDEQAKSVASHIPIIVANPDRLQELLQEHRFIFRHLNLLVLDEMDQMVARDSKNTLKQIKRRILSDYTALICSEKIDGPIKKVSLAFTDEPSIEGFETEISDNDNPPTPSPIRGNLKQCYIKVPNRMKISTLMAHIEETSDNNCVIFTASKRGTDRLYRVLKKRGLKATSLHGKLSDEKRDQRFANFTNGDLQYLLVSDISAADLELSGVVQVINYDVPNSPDEYRFRAALVAETKGAQLVSLVSKQDQNDISQLQNELGQTPNEIPLPDQVKQKLKQRKNTKQQPQKIRDNNKPKKSRDNRSRPPKSNELQLPQPSYDKLSGGRSGNHDEKETGIVKFFKKLFS